MLAHLQRLAWDRSGQDLHMPASPFPAGNPGSGVRFLAPCRYVRSKVVSVWSRSRCLNGLARCVSNPPMM